MKTTDFDFHLPDHLIATHPTKERSSSRLLRLDRFTGNIDHHHFYNLVDILNSNDLLIMNNSKVIPARVYGCKESGGKVEMLIERIIDQHSALAHLKASKALKTGYLLFFGTDKTPFKILGRKDDLFIIEKQTQSETLLTWLQHNGHMPLPPYMHRNDEENDAIRYQTVYASPEGSIAAPTAGLHFDNPLLEKIRQKGIDMATVTLHVGSGTFQPVRVEYIKDHSMHHEWFSLPQATCDAITACRERGGRVIAVGTTTVRTLESAAKNSIPLKPMDAETNIFIYPGFEFKIVDAMITNFHLPKSTLLMLVNAFCPHIPQAYQEAIRENYRFYSYGDAMLIDS